MNAIEFVKTFGIECARGIANNSENRWAYDHILDEYFNGDDVEILDKAINLVEKCKND